MSASTLRSHSDSTSLAARHNTVARSLRAELYRLRSWPAMWTTVGTWFLLTMPSAGALLRSAGTAYLVFMMWGTIGFALGTYARSAALSVGLGLVWDGCRRESAARRRLRAAARRGRDGLPAGDCSRIARRRGDRGRGHTRGGGCDLGTEGAHHRRRLHRRRSGHHRDSGAEPGRELTAKILPVG